MKFFPGAVVAAMLSLALALPVRADAARIGDLEVAGVWARATLRNGAPSGAFLSIKNSGRQADRLIAVSSPLAKTAEVHLSAMSGGVMKMRRVAHLDIPPQGMVMLEPGAYHIMLMGLAKALKAGGRLPLTLTFARAGKLTVQAEVRALGGRPKKHKMKKPSD